MQVCIVAAGNENMEQKYAYIFGKKAKGDDYYRYWISMSSEKVGKNGKATGEYLKATMPVRMSKKAAETREIGRASCRERV